MKTKNESDKTNNPHTTNSNIENISLNTNNVALCPLSSRI